MALFEFRYFINKSLIFVVDTNVGKSVFGEENCWSMNLGEPMTLEFVTCLKKIKSESNC